MNGHASGHPGAMSEADKEMYEMVKKIIRPNKMLDTMKAGGLALVYTSTITHSIEIVGMAKYHGYQGFSLNLEHERNGWGQAVDACCACLLAGITPVIIVPSLQSDWVSRLLDNGAQAIIVPRVNNPEMAQEFVRMSKYRPLGERPLADIPQMIYQIPDFKYTQAAGDATTLTIPMIETVEGLENCESICAVRGVDAVFIGAHDLSDDLGIGGEFDNPVLHEAIAKICNAAKKASTDEKEVYVGVGGMEPYPELFSKLRKAHPNIRFANAGRDVNMINEGMQKALNKFSGM